MNTKMNYQTELPAAFTSWTAFRDWTTAQGMGDLGIVTYLVPLPDPASPKGPKLLTPHYYQRKLLNAQANAETPAKKGTRQAGKR